MPACHGYLAADCMHAAPEAATRDMKAVPDLPAVADRRGVPPAARLRPH